VPVVVASGPLFEPCTRRWIVVDLDGGWIRVESGLLLNTRFLVKVGQAASGRIFAQVDGDKEPVELCGPDRNRDTLEQLFRSLTVGNSFLFRSEAEAERGLFQDLVDEHYKDDAGKTYPPAT
jgi:hypothetical protein